jgi:hypothetical protein
LSRPESIRYVLDAMASDFPHTKLCDMAGSRLPI